MDDYDPDLLYVVSQGALTDNRGMESFALASAFFVDYAASVSGAASLYFDDKALADALKNYKDALEDLGLITDGSDWSKDDFEGMMPTQRKFLDFVVFMAHTTNIDTNE